MTTSNEYITLCTSGSEISKKFYAIMVNGGYIETHEKAQTIETNIEGDPLITNGGIVKYFSYVLKVTQEVEDSSFGTKDELTQLFDLNNPNGTPSDVITLIDHYGVSRFVKFIKSYDLTPLTSVLVGTEAYFYVPIKLIEVLNE